MYINQKFFKFILSIIILLRQKKEINNKNIYNRVLNKNKKKSIGYYQK